MSGTAPVRVVVVDDAVEMRELLGLALARSSDFAVVAEAADGAAGVQAVADTLPELVLLDVSMPVMDGLEALRVIRAEHPDRGGDVLRVRRPLRGRAAVGQVGRARVHPQGRDDVRTDRPAACGGGCGA